MTHLQDDTEIFGAISREFARQHEHIEMIASENYTFPAVMEAMASVLTNKYAEGYPRKRYYGGCEFVDEVEDIAISRAKKLFSCDFANVQPHSGSQANFGVFTALLGSGDKILGMDLTHGGHLTHGARANASGKYFQSFFYGVNENGLIDYDRVLDIAKITRPKLIIAGFSAYPRELDFAKFREIADEVGALLMADIAHVAGLVVAHEYSNPLPHCHVVTTTTHKTLRGPRGGLILTNDQDLATKIDRAIFPGIQGGPLMHVIAAKAVGFRENLRPEWKIYAQNVKKNIKILEGIFRERGIKMVSDGSDNHLLLLDFSDRDFSGKEADAALEAAGIAVNKNTVPNDRRSPLVTSGVRLGSAALTARGFGSHEFEIVGQRICDVLSDVKNGALHEKIREELKNLAAGFRIYERPIFG